MANSQSQRRLAVTVCLALGCALVQPAFPARKHSRPSAAALLAKRRAIEARRAQVREHLRATIREQKAAGKAYNQSRGRLISARHELRATTSRLIAAKSQLQQATDQLIAAKKRLALHLAALSELLRDIYARSHARPFALAEGVSGFSDFANRMYLSKRVARQALDLLDRIEDEKERVSRYRDAVEDRKEQVSALREEAGIKHNAVARETIAFQRECSKLAQQRAYWERALAELERTSNAIAAMIRRLQRSPAGRVRYLRPWRGGFMQPVAGRLTSEFGYRMHPILRRVKFHTGVDIAAPTGTAIHAAGSGFVVHSARLGGYGNCIIIDHGGGRSTVYGHCSALYVRAGQTVKRGQAIGAVGSTGLSTGPHLHWEVRRNGTPVSP